MSQQGEIITRMVPQASYKPSVYYFRKALRESRSHERAVVVGLIVCHELELLKEWVRSKGLIPPKTIVLEEEADEKGWSLESGDNSSGLLIPSDISSTGLNQPSPVDLIGWATDRLRIGLDQKSQ